MTKLLCQVVLLPGLHPETPAACLDVQSYALVQDAFLLAFNFAQPWCKYRICEPLNMYKFDFNQHASVVCKLLAFLCFSILENLSIKIESALGWHFYSTRDGRKIVQWFFLRLGGGCRIKYLVFWIKTSRRNILNILKSRTCPLCLQFVQQKTYKENEVNEEPGLNVELRAWTRCTGKIGIMWKCPVRVGFFFIPPSLCVGRTCILAYRCPSFTLDVRFYMAYCKYFSNLTIAILV